MIVLLRMTLLGKGVRALMQSPTGAQLVGINACVLHPLMFGIGLGLSGIAGALLSMAYTISPSMGEPYTVTAPDRHSRWAASAAWARWPAACCWAWSRRSACTTQSLAQGAAVLRRVHRRAAAPPRGACSRARCGNAFHVNCCSRPAGAAGDSGWALAAYWGSEFIVSLALTCLMYVALSSSWALFCGFTRYLSLATSAFSASAPTPARCRWSSMPWLQAVALGAGIAANRSRW